MTRPRSGSELIIFRVKAGLRARTREPYVRLSMTVSRDQRMSIDCDLAQATEIRDWLTAAIHNVEELVATREQATRQTETPDDQG